MLNMPQRRPRFPQHPPKPNINYLSAVASDVSNVRSHPRSLALYLSLSLCVSLSVSVSRPCSRYRCLAFLRAIAVAYRLLSPSSPRLAPVLFSSHVGTTKRLQIRGGTRCGDAASSEKPFHGGKSSYLEDCTVCQITLFLPTCRAASIGMNAPDAICSTHGTRHDRKRCPLRCANSSQRSRRSVASRIKLLPPGSRAKA